MRNISLDFFEGLLVGIYGNWMIALYTDKIDFGKVTTNDFIILLISFLALIGYAYFMISKRGKITTLKMYVLLTIIHTLGWGYVYSNVGIGNFYQKTMFFLIGLSLFVAIFLAEKTRLKEANLNENKQITKTKV